MYEDRTLKCEECGEEFIFSAGEQEYFASKGFVNDPKRCKSCRDKRKNAPRVYHDAKCVECGRACRVPFKPTGEKPVYCSECYARVTRQAEQNKKEIEKQVEKQMDSFNK